MSDGKKPAQAGAEESAKKQHAELWAMLRGHVDPGDEWDAARMEWRCKLSAFERRQHAIPEHKAFIYKCAKLQWGGGAGREMTLAEYDAFVTKAMDGTHAR